jgi:O-antigen ligase
MVKNPVLGVGPNVFSIAEGMSHEGEGKWSAAHNSFVQIGAELGITGLVLFLSMLISSVKSLYSARSRLPVGAPEINFICAIEVGFYGYAATGFFLSQGYATLLFLLVGLSVVVANLSRQDVTLTDKAGSIADISAVKANMNMRRI